MKGGAALLGVRPGEAGPFGTAPPACDARPDADVPATPQEAAAVAGTLHGPRGHALTER